MNWSYCGSFTISSRAKLTKDIQSWPRAELELPSLWAKRRSNKIEKSVELYFIYMLINTHIIIRDANWRVEDQIHDPSSLQEDSIDKGPGLGQQGEQDCRALHPRGHPARSLRLPPVFPQTFHRFCHVPEKPQPKTPREAGQLKPAQQQTRESVPVRWEQSNQLRLPKEGPRVWDTRHRARGRVAGKLHWAVQLRPRASRQLYSVFGGTGGKDKRDQSHFRMISVHFGFLILAGGARPLDILGGVQLYLR